MSSHGTSRPPSVSNAGSSTTTVTSEMSMAYRNRKVIKRLNSWYYGSGKFPFKVAIVCFVLGFLLLFAGVVLFGLIFGQRQLSVGNWWGNIVAAALIVAAILVTALGAKFLFDARAKSTADRKKISFKPKGLTKVSVVNTAYESDKESNYKTKSGTTSIKAVNSPYQSSIGTRSLVATRSVGGSRHSVANSLARTGDSLPSLDNRGPSPHVGSNNGSYPARQGAPPQGRYVQNKPPGRYDDERGPPPSRYEDRRGYDDDDDRRSDGRYDDDRRPAGRHDDDRRPAGRHDDDRRPAGRHDDDRRPAGRHDDDRRPAGRHDDDRRPAGRDDDDRRPAGRRDDERRQPSSRSGSRSGSQHDFSEIPLDDHYI